MKKSLNKTILFLCCFFSLTLLAHDNNILSESLLNSSDNWTQLLQDSLEVAKKIKGSVERNRLRRLIEVLQSNSQDMQLNSVKNHALQKQCTQIQWQWIDDKIKKRMLGIQKNLAQGPDKQLILSVLQLLSQEVSKNNPPSSVLPEVRTATATAPDEAEEERRQHIHSMLQTHLPKIKAHLKEFSPRVFISYAWADSERTFAKKIAEHLKLAGMDVRVDIWCNGLSTAILTEFVSEIEAVDYIILICSPLYAEKYRQKNNNSVFIEARIIAERYKSQPSRILPILHSGAAKETIPPFLRDHVYANFSNQKSYVKELSKTILALCKYSDDCEGLKRILNEMEEHALIMQKQ